MFDQLNGTALSSGKSKAENHGNIVVYNEFEDGFPWFSCWGVTREDILDSWLKKRVVPPAGPSPVKPSQVMLYPSPSAWTWRIWALVARCWFCWHFVGFGSVWGYFGWIAMVFFFAGGWLNFVEIILDGNLHTFVTIKSSAFMVNSPCLVKNQHFNGLTCLTHSQIMKAIIFLKHGHSRNPNWRYLPYWRYLPSGNLLHSYWKWPLK